VVAVSQVDVDVMPGTIVGLIGPNGAGKTTLVDAITGFVPGAGTTIFCGEDISRAKPHQRVRRGLSRTFQAAELWDDLTVGENIAVGATGGIEDVVAFSGLDELRDISVSELSHGHRRVVSIARALATGPSVVLLDEPAAGLDSLETEALGRHLLAMRDSGVAVLLVDHDMNLVMSVCDKLYVLDFGKVIASGSPEEILNNPIVSAAYLGDVNVAEVQVAE
jgi:ABC-type branched-subunit amino acid transport system ATPase component